MSRLKLAATGATVVLVYVVVAAWTFGSGIYPIRPIYEGLSGPQPYAWVNPPPDLKTTNQPPASGAKDVVLEKKGSGPGSVFTDDGQAGLLFGPSAFVDKPGQTAIHITVTPSDPATFGAPPKGLDYDGNAYAIAATYVPSGEPAEIAPCEGNACPTVTLQYPFDPIDLYQRDGSSWVRVASTTYASALKIAGPVSQLGDFVVTHKGGKRSGVGSFITFGLGLAAILGATMIAASRARRRSGGPPPKSRPPARSRAKKKARTFKRWLRSG